MPRRPYQKFPGPIDGQYGLGMEVNRRDRKVATLERTSLEDDIVGHDEVMSLFIIAWHGTLGYLMWTCVIEVGVVSNGIEGRTSSVAVPLPVAHGLWVLVA